MTASVALCETSLPIIFAPALAFGGSLFRYRSTFLAFIAVTFIGHLFVVWVERNHNLTYIVDWIYANDSIGVI